MTTPSYPTVSKEDCRLQAMIALFRGEKASDVSATFGIARSNLYKFRAHVLAAMREALRDRPRGPKRPHNRLAPQREQAVVSFCQRHPTLSSYQVHQHLGPAAPHPRTIQRVRKRSGLARLSKRAPPSMQARRVSRYATTRVQDAIRHKPYLGPERIAWDLQNGEGLQISPATIKRLKKTLHKALYPPPPSPVWRFYERHHPHSLWHGDFMEKVTLTDLDHTAYQLTLLDDYSRGYLFCDLFLTIAVGMPVTRHPPHRSVRAARPHTALTSDAWRQSGRSETDAGYAGWESNGGSAP